MRACGGNPPTRSRSSTRVPARAGGACSRGGWTSPGGAALRSPDPPDVTDFAAAPATDDSRPHRTVRSFVLRQGRMSPAQRNALTALWPRFGVDYAARPLDFGELFGRRAPVV